MRYMKFTGFIAFILVTVFQQTNIIRTTSAQGAMINWAPAKISHQSYIGTVSFVSVSFTSATKLENLTISIVPELSRYVSISPSSFQPVPAYEPQQVNVSFTIPKNADLQTLNGTIHLIQGKKTIAKPLPITLEIQRPTLTVVPQSIALPSPDRVMHEPGTSQLYFAKDQVNVFFKKNIPFSTIQEVVSGINGLIIGSIPEDNCYQILVPEEGYDNLSALIDQLNQNDNVLFAKHHTIIPTSAVPDDPGSMDSYVFSLINLPGAWDITTGEKITPLNHQPLKIAVIDSGFAITHPDLKENVKFSEMYTQGQESHGTATASIVGARGNNGIDISGVMWRTFLYLYGAGSTAGSGNIDSGALSKALNQAINDKVRVVNLSFGIGCDKTGCLPSETRQLIEEDKFYKYYFDKAKSNNVDVLWVVSAGNNHTFTGFDSPARLSLYPSYTEVISVAAVDSNKALAIFNSSNNPGSNYGATVAAPGLNVPALRFDGGYRNNFSGTSAAAPYVTGVAGLMLSVNPFLTAAQIKQIIRDQSDETDTYDPDGNELQLLNAYRVVNAAKDLLPACDQFLDATFGNNGLLVSDFGALEQAESIILQPDGKILVAGNMFNERYYALIARYNIDGSLDETFGDNGRTIADLNMKVVDIVLQGNGQIVMAGTKLSYDQFNVTNDGFALARFNLNGSLDIAFGDNGVVTTNIGGQYEEMTSATIQSDGKILAVGYTSINDQVDLVMVRYHGSGNFDNTFGLNGIAVFNYRYWDMFRSVAVQPDGKIIVGGETYQNPPSDFTLARFHADGTLDLTFGENGVVVTDYGASEAIRDIAIQTDGKIVAVGVRGGWSSSVIVMTRYNINGTYDITFGNNGLVMTSLGPGKAVPNDLVIQHDGKMIVAGLWDVTNDGDPCCGDYAVIRYHTDGSVDNDFGDNGRVISDFGGYDYLSALALQSDGKIIAAGTVYNAGRVDIGLSRYNGSGCWWITSP